MLRHVKATASAGTKTPSEDVRPNMYKGKIQCSQNKALS